LVSFRGFFEDHFLGKTLSPEKGGKKIYSCSNQNLKVKKGKERPTLFFNK
jgi:hypothetical protein